MSEERDWLTTNGIEKSENASAALLLRNHMSDMSEDFFCATWLLGLEYDLWKMMRVGPPQIWGFGTPSAHQISALYNLSQRSGGWWRWNQDAQAHEFMTLQEWKDVINREDAESSDIENDIDVLKKIRPGTLLGPRRNLKQNVSMWSSAPGSDEFSASSLASFAGTWDVTTQCVAIEKMSVWVKILTQDACVGWVGVWNLEICEDAPS